MDKRFEKINRLLINYSQGNFNSSIRLSRNLDEIDAFISNINMLGEELKETTITRDYFNDIFNSVSDMIFVLDRNGFIKETNRTVINTFNTEPGFFESKHIDYIINDKPPSVFQALKRKLAKHEEAERFETSFKKNDKSVFPVSCAFNNLLDEKGKKTGYIVIANDISARKEYEYSLMQSEKKFRELFEHSHDCIFIIDQQAKTIELNNAGYKLFKIDPLSANGLSLLKGFERNKKIKELMIALRKKRMIKNNEVNLKKSDGTLMNCLISASVFYGRGKRDWGIRGTIKDITDQKETEKLLIRTIIDTQEQERIRFAKDIHDSLGQQLSAIKFYIGTTINSPITEKSKGILEKSNDALIRVLADMRNICFNLMPKTLENYGIVEAVQELCNQIELTNRLMFNISSSENFPALGKSLEIALFRIVQEFINNSIKHGKASKIGIRFRKLQKVVRIELQDNGVGFNINSAKGAGMGLQNIRSRVISYGGEIIISSVLNKGTKFLITIPLKNN